MKITKLFLILLTCFAVRCHAADSGNSATVQSSSPTVSQSDTRTLQERQAEWDLKVARHAAYIKAVQISGQKPLISPNLDFGPRPTE